MMMKEFTDRTGFEPTCDEYAEIEEAYYQFDGNKDEFCRRFISEGGIQKVYEARAEKIALLKSKLVESDKLLRQTMDDYEKWRGRSHQPDCSLCRTWGRVHQRGYSADRG